VNQQGAIADYLEVESGYERAVEACLGDLLQHIVVDSPEHAAAGFGVVRDASAGRCGFLITDLAPAPVDAPLPPQGVDRVIPLSAVVQVNGPFAHAIRSAISNAWIADSYDEAAGVSRATSVPVATLAGDLFRGPHLVAGGGGEQALGILQTKREIKELRDRIQTERDSLLRLAEETADLEGTIAQAGQAIAALNAEHHKHEKMVVGHEAQLQHASEESARLVQKGEQLARERRQAEEERETLDRRQDEARASIGQLEGAQQVADERLTVAQRRVFEAREAAEALSQRAADARAAHAGFVERAAGLTADVERLEEAFADLELRAASLTAELDQTARRVDDLRASVEAGEARLHADLLALDALRLDVGKADDAVSTLRIASDEHERVIKEARSAFESVRTIVSELDVVRATAEADLSHLAHTCVDAVNATLDEVLVEVEQLEAEGHGTPDPTVALTDEPAEDESEDTAMAAVASAEQRTITAEEAIARLRAKIERLGPVNMMAIDQFDELERRHEFLTTQRNDLVDSIRQTTEAIKRIDETTRQRFSEAFAAINTNFQGMFSTLFGGGRAGLTLLDENDPLESGIEIIAQPPGKRLQSVQLLSGGEKALTAIALMFGMFKYKPSPFCLLDEIDAPLDDANIGRFVEMLRSMQEHTQFIVITHNRKTMEIADRLYGVTMEEPGVSKLISVQLN
jgi:chromosome segregation protein